MYLNSANRTVPSLVPRPNQVDNNNTNRNMTCYIASIVSHIILLVQTFVCMGNNGSFHLHLNLSSKLGNSVALNFHILNCMQLS